TPQRERVWCLAAVDSNGLGVARVPKLLGMFRAHGVLPARSHLPGSWLALHGVPVRPCAEPVEDDARDGSVDARIEQHGTATLGTARSGEPDNRRCRLIAALRLRRLSTARPLPVPVLPPHRCTARGRRRELGFTRAWRCRSRSNDDNLAPCP